MLNNTTQDNPFQLSICLQITLIAPDYVGLLILSSGLYGMYQGIEVQHPLYAILFINLIIPSVLSMVDILAFVVIAPIEKYIMLTNVNSCISTFFHFTCWCLSSIIRYIYMVHENKLHEVIPSMKRQCHIAIALAIIFSIALSAPLLGYAVYLGWYEIKIFLRSFFSICIILCSLFFAAATIF
jgi:hypothetical protein